MKTNPTRRVSKPQRLALLCAYAGWSMPLYSVDDPFSVRKSTLDSLIRKGHLTPKSEEVGDVAITSSGELALGLEPMENPSFREALEHVIAVLLPDYFIEACIVPEDYLHDVCVEENDGYGITDSLSADRMLGALDLEKSNYIPIFDNGEFDLLLDCVGRRLFDLGFKVSVELHPGQLVFIAI